jgi:hypothetical protein
MRCVYSNPGHTQIIMSDQIRIEIIGRDEFWRNAVLVEWDHQYPERPLTAQSNACYLIETKWLVDLKRVADGCFSKVLVAPEDLSRRLWLTHFIPSRRDSQT